MHDEELYRQNILELYKHPHNKREMTDATLSGVGVNVSCGDKINFYIKLDLPTGQAGDDRVSGVSFTGDGCAISIASVSMLTDKVKNKTLDELRALAPGDIYNMLGVQISPGRVNCALLGYEAMNHALLGHRMSK